MEEMNNMTKETINSVDEVKVETTDVAELAPVEEAEDNASGSMIKTLALGAITAFAIAKGAKWLWNKATEAKETYDMGKEMRKQQDEFLFAEDFDPEKVESEVVTENNNEEN